MLRTCPAAALLSSHAHNACADAAPDSVLPDPVRDVKPSDTRCCKNTCTTVHAAGRKPHSNPVDGTTEPKNLRLAAVCAGPRAAPPRQLTPLVARVASLSLLHWSRNCMPPRQPTPPVARAAAADNAAAVLGDGRGHSRSPDTVGWPANAASDAPLADRTHWNNGNANAAARTAARIL